MSATNAVLDASAFLRAAVEQTDVARLWIGAVEAGDVKGTVPEHFYLEVANGLRTYVGADHMRAAVAIELLARCLDLPLVVTSVRDVASPALALGLERDLTAYDASYLVLAEATDAVLVTSDRKLASAYSRVELVA